MLRTFASRYVAVADADDVAQAATLKLLGQASSFDSSRDAIAWACAFAANEIRTLRKRTARHREVAHVPMESLHPERSPEQQLEARQLERALLEALATLRPADAETLRAVIQGNRPTLPGATFRKRVERALERLRIVWRARHGVD
jgi:RNA polymerase sigma-70 factor (ECF subfamily)